VKLLDLKRIIDDGENEIFNQSISFFNPSGLYGDLTVEDLKTDSYRASTRNKLLAEALYLTNDIEKYGSGYIRIRKEIENYPSMRFSYNEIANGYIAELSYNIQKTTTDVNENVTVNPENVTVNPENVTVNPVNNRSKKIVEEIKENPNVSASELSVKFKVTERTIKRDLQILKKEKVIIRVGSDKTGYWKVL